MIDDRLPLTFKLPQLSLPPLTVEGFKKLICTLAIDIMHKNTLSLSISIYIHMLYGRHTYLNLISNQIICIQQCGSFEIWNSFLTKVTSFKVPYKLH